jgi:hypothetical protein
MIKNMVKVIIIVIILVLKDFGKMIYFMVLDIGNKFYKIINKKYSYYRLDILDILKMV